MFLFPDPQSPSDTQYGIQDFPPTFSLLFLMKKTKSNNLEASYTHTTMSSKQMSDFCPTLP